MACKIETWRSIVSGVRFGACSGTVSENEKANSLHEQPGVRVVLVEVGDEVAIAVEELGGNAFVGADHAFARLRRP